MTPSEVYDKYIKDSDANKFKLYYLIKKEGVLNVAGMNFESNDENYCLNLLSKIANQPNFYSWIFDKEALAEAIERNKTK